MIRKARVDSNQKEIVTQLRKMGYSVLVISTLKNCFDILVGARNRNYAFEIKDGNKPPSQRKLTEGEDKFFTTWNGQINIITSVEDALQIINNTSNGNR